MSVQNILQTVISTVSILSCATILFTFFVFPDLRKKSFIATVFFICLSDMISSIGQAMAGAGKHNTDVCWAQGILINFFTLASVMWTVIICYMMYWIKVKGKLLTANIWCHAICWGVPSIATFLPLFDSSLHFSYNSICLIIPDKAAYSWLAVLWRWVSYYGIIWCAIAVNIVLLILVYRSIRADAAAAAIQNSHSTNALYIALKKLCWYPTIVLVIYGENCIADMFLSQFHSSRHQQVLQQVTALLPCFLGTLNSVAFWISNPDIRKQLGVYLFSIEKQVIAMPEHFFHCGKEGAITSIHSVANNIAKVAPLVREWERALEEQSLNLYDSSARKASESLNSIVLSIHTKRKKTSGRVLPGLNKYEATDDEDGCQHSVSGTNYISMNCSPKGVDQNETGHDRKQGDADGLFFSTATTSATSTTRVSLTTNSASNSTTPTGRGVASGPEQGLFMENAVNIVTQKFVVGTVPCILEERHESMSSIDIPMTPTILSAATSIVGRNCSEGSSSKVIDMYKAHKEMIVRRRSNHDLLSGVSKVEDKKDSGFDEFEAQHSGLHPCLTKELTEDMETNSVSLILEGDAAEMFAAEMNSPGPGSVTILRCVSDGVLTPDTALTGNELVDMMDSIV